MGNTTPKHSTIPFNYTHFHQILMGGDQLTLAEQLFYSLLDRLEDITPVIKDWNARLTLMKVIYLMYICNL